MFEICVTPEFEAWYQALDAQAAEAVAVQLDVLERVGPELPGASRLLLWFDGTEGGGLPWGLDLRLAADQLAGLVTSEHEALRCLQTPAFLARFAELDTADAARTSALIDELRRVARAATTRFWLSHPGERGVVGSFWPAKSGVRALPGARALGEEDAVRDALRRVLESAGLGAADVADTSSGLRELTLRELSPPVRLLYALDVPRRRVLAIVGERLDRAYYGDSVRLAERHYREYCRTRTAVAHR